jgi:hypothetical protein
MKKLFFSLTLAGAVALALPSAALAAPGQARGLAGGGHAVVRGGVYGHPLGARVVPYYRGYRGFAYDPFWYGGGWGYYGYAYPYIVPTGVVTGGLRLEIEPKTAQVFVDGYYAGVVDDFNGHFQHLDLTPGGHRIEVRQPGFQPLTIDPYIQPDHTTDFKAALTPAAQPAQ